MKNIELPRKVLVGPDAVFETDQVVCELGLNKRPLIICDPNTVDVAGHIICGELDAEPCIIEDTGESMLGGLVKKIKNDGLGYVIGIGGGRILDAGKVVAFESKTPFISVPTAASHDGIASPQASLKRDKPTSVQVHCPLGVIADTKIISKAPKRLLAAGCADAISNYTAVLDWRLAHEKRGEYFGDYAAALSSMTAKMIMDNPGAVKRDVSILLEALISSGVAIGIAGTSRPCSGSEHLFSHTLDMICEKPAMHGEQCGVGTILMACLHSKDWESVREALKICGSPVDALGLGIGEDKIVQALTMAHGIRDRYTILGDGLSGKKARELAIKTGVIG